MRETHVVDPVAVSAILSASRRTVTVRIGGLGSRGLWRAPTPGALGFEVLGADELWHSTPIVGSGADSVTVGPAPRGARAARYLFYASPCGLECYQCPVCAAVRPLGNLSGERQDFLPLAPFVMKIS